MIRRAANGPRKRYAPTNGKLAWAALKGAAMGALLTMIFVKFLP